MKPNRFSDYQVFKLLDREREVGRSDREWLRKLGGRNVRIANGEFQVSNGKIRRWMSLDGGHENCEWREWRIQMPNGRFSRLWSVEVASGRLWSVKNFLQLWPGEFQVLKVMRLTAYNGI